MPKKRSSRSAKTDTAPKRKKRGRPAKPKPTAAPEQLPPERPIEEGDGLNFITLVEAASRRNGQAKRKDPTLDVVDLPDVCVMIAGGPRTPGSPFRLSVPDLGGVIVDPQLATLAPEGERTTRTLEASSTLRVRAEKYATRVVGPLQWRWTKPRAEPPITPREKEFLERLAARIVDRLVEERRAAASRTDRTSPDR